MSHNTGLNLKLDEKTLSAIKESGGPLTGKNRE